MKLPADTIILDMNSPTFLEDLEKAVGLKPGETMEFTTPEFGRTDGMRVIFPSDFNDWENLHKKDSAALTALGFGVWDETPEGKHWLYPKEWYNFIPDGHPIVYITKKLTKFKHGETDDDCRMGFLAFGFIQKL